MFRRGSSDDSSSYRPKRSLLGRLRRRSSRDGYYGDDGTAGGGRRAGGPLRWATAPARWAGSAVRGVGRGAGATWSAVRGGWSSRNGRELLRGLPALLAVAAVAAAAVASGIQSRRLEGRYRAAADSAFEAGEAEAANLYYRRLAQLDDGGPQTRFRMALTYQDLEQGRTAAELMNGLMGEDGSPGYAPAHRWAANRLLNSEGAAENSALIAEAHRHLLQARRGAPEDVEVALNLAQYYAAVGDLRRAVPLLREAAEERPGLNFDLARLHARLGDVRGEARADAAAESHFRNLVRIDPADHTARARWAGTLVSLGRFEEAVGVLSEGAERDPAGFAPLLGAAFLVEYDRMKEAGDARYGRRLSLLREALKLRPNDPQALVRLIDFADGGGAAEEAEAAEFLQGVLARGEVPAAAHLALGARAWAEEDAETAAFHLKQAYELDPSLGVVANNLAWVLAHRPDPDTDRALRLIDTVVTRWPDVPTYRDTRGEILRLLGRDAEALPELERALAGGLSEPRLHASLAAVYDGLGRDSLAARHRALAGDAPAGGPKRDGSVRPAAAAAPGK